MALIGLAILCCSAGCSQQAPPAKAKSRFTQAGFDAIAIACGLKRGALLLDGTRSVRFGSAVTGDYRKLNCVQTKIRETYYPAGKAGVAGNALQESEGENAQAH